MMRHFGFAALCVSTVLSIASVRALRLALVDAEAPQPSEQLSAQDVEPEDVPCTPQVIPSPPKYKCPPGQHFDPACIQACTEQYGAMYVSAFEWHCLGQRVADANIEIRLIACVAKFAECKNACDEFDYVCKAGCEIAYSNCREHAAQRYDAEIASLEAGFVARTELARFIYWGCAAACCID